MMLFKSTIALLALVCASEAQDCAPPVRNSNCIYNRLSPYPTNLKCGTQGMLSSPAVLTKFSPCATISYDACKDLCRSLKPCISFSYDSGDGATEPCTLYRKTLINMGFQTLPDNSSTVHYWNKFCFGQQCTNLVLNSGFEYTNTDGSVANWTGSSDANSKCYLTHPAVQDAAVAGSFSYTCLCVTGACDFVVFDGSLATPADPSTTYDLIATMKVRWDPAVDYLRVRALLGGPGGSQLYLMKFCQPNVTTSCESGEFLPGDQIYKINSTFVPGSDSTDLTFIVDYSNPGTTSGTLTSFDNIQIVPISTGQN